MPDETPPDNLDSRLQHMASQGFTPSQALGMRASAPWQPPTPEELQAQMPQYKVLDLLGCGGMGAVYKGWQTSLERYVAIKILPPALDNDAANFTARFKQEAKTMARLSHPGIVPVHDAGQTATGLLYFVMEFVEGTDVAQMVKTQGKLDPAHALAITAHVCDALAYAHEHGVIHRDIKPANVMLNHEGEVKVADFGLAKSTAPGGGGLTRTDMAMGTPDFIAPEALITGIAVDHRADLFAVGVMLYNMLTGGIPRGRWKLPSETAGTDARFDAIINRAMEPDREHRYQNAREIRRDLDVILTTPLEKPSPPPQKREVAFATPHENKKAASQKPPPKKSSTGMIAGIIGAAAVIGIGAFFAFKKPAKKPLDDPAETSSSTGASSASVGGTTKDAPFVNSLGMKFVPVPGTKVLFSIWETRVQDYAAYARMNKVDGEWQTQQMDGVAVSRESEHPVVGVNWNDAVAFCQWLTEKETAERKLPRGACYRLPKDEEWSHAVDLPADRPGRDESFPWGDGWPPKKKVGNYGDTAFHEKFPKAKAWSKSWNRAWINNYTDGFAATAPVGSFPPNQFGIYDLGGNACEWCEDIFEPGSTDRILRGASWFNLDREFLLSSHRDHDSPTRRSNGAGFRCVLESATSPTLPATNAPQGSSLPTATKDAPFVNTLGIKFVPVPITGGPTGGQRVLFSVWETRVQDYEAFVKETRREWPKLPFEQGPTHPAVNVSWEDAQLFCQWLTERERKAGKLSATERYRLPTDHEWSCAVGIGDREDAAKPPNEKHRKVANVFPWGGDWPPPPGAGNFSGEETDGHEIKLKPQKPLAGYRDGFIATSPAGSFEANAAGLFDLGGNVSEWCEDWFDASQKKRVLRGGSWSDFDRSVHLSSSRLELTPATRNGLYGFRCVLAPSAP